MKKMNSTTWARWALVGGALSLLACTSAGEVSGTPPPGGSFGVSQGGPQDVGHFRAIVDRGEIPRPGVLEPVGFFAEHQVDLPPADCGERICLHPMLAVAPDLHGENWTMAFVAMNTPVDAASLPRPATHVVVVVEDTEAVGANFGATYEATMRALTLELEAADRLSLVRAGSVPQVLVHGVSAGSADIRDAAEAFGYRDTRVALYDALGLASQLTGELDDFEGATRIVVVGTGRADAGITDSERLVALAEALGREGVGLGYVGLGEDYRAELPRQMSEASGGTLAFAERPAALQEIFRLEGRTSIFPLATDVSFIVEPAPGYRVGRVYGARRARVDDGLAELTSPVLVLGNRRAADDVSEGRRGGGGGLFVELLPDADSEIGRGAPAFSVRGAWTDAESGERVTVNHVVDNALAPGEVPGGMWPHFSDPARGKAFMMLNMYLTLHVTTDFFHAGNCAMARGVLPAMQLSYEGWQDEYEDPDIDADWELVRALHQNVETQCQAVPPQVPQGGELGCFFI